MKRFNIFIFLTLLLLPGLLLAGCGKTDYNDAVAKQLSRYNGEFKLLQCYEEEVDDVDYVVYQYQTDDNLEIIFEVKCHMGYKSFPLGGTYLTKSQIVTDNFYESICNYYSESLDALVIDDMSLEDIIEYVMKQMSLAEDLLEAYGIVKIPNLSFVLIKNEEEYTLGCAYFSESLLHSRLLELLY